MGGLRSLLLVLSNKCQHPQVFQVLMAVSRHLAPLAGVLVVTVPGNQVMFHLHPFSLGLLISTLLCLSLSLVAL